jgi:hypothetical protein
MKKMIIVLISFFFTSGFANYKEYKNFPEPKPTSKGQLIFQEMGCPMCHGHNGRGNGFLAQGLEPRPRNFTSFEQMKGVPYQSMYTAIKDGISFTGMPSFDLKDEQIDDVISYVRSFLTENYITISTCLNIPQVVSLENIETGGRLNIEKDKPELVSASMKAGEITLTPNIEVVRKLFKEKKSKLLRVHVNLTKTNEEQKKYMAIIALRISNCIK